MKDNNNMEILEVVPYSRILLNNMFLLIESKAVVKLTYEQ